jgi:GNAT superfamily N-acetyltransferase
MTPALRIEPAGPADVPVILGMIKALAEYEKLAHEVVADEAQLHESLFVQRGAEVLIGYAGDEAVGFAVYFHSYSTFLGRRAMYLEDLFVLPSWRGHGFGRALFSRVAAIAVERGCGRMDWSVLDWNAPAIGFYTRMGARPLDDWTVFRLTDASLRAAATDTDRS